MFCRAAVVRSAASRGAPRKAGTCRRSLTLADIADPATVGRSERYVTSEDDEVARAAREALEIPAAQSLKLEVSKSKSQRKEIGGRSLFETLRL
jgi:hypothetical protein